MAINPVARFVRHRFGAQGGFTLIELTTAMVMSGVVLAGIFIIVSGSHSYILKARDRVNLQQDFSLIDKLLAHRIRGGIYGRQKIYASYADYTGSGTPQSSGTCLKIYYPLGDSTVIYTENNDLKIQKSDLTITNLVQGIVDSVLFTHVTNAVATNLTLVKDSKTLTGDLVHKFRNKANRLLFVVPNAAGLAYQDRVRRDLMESWGYMVALITASDSQANFDAAADTSDIAYITENVYSADLNTKLKSSALGFVNEERALHDDYGFSSAEGSFDDSQIDITDNSHYITSVFNTGLLNILSSASELQTATGTLAAGGQVLSEQPSSSNAALLIIERGGALYGGGNAAGRRVYLPWGRNNFEFSQLNDQGKTLMRRAIEWAAGHGE